MFHGWESNGEKKGNKEQKGDCKCKKWMGKGERVKKRKEVRTGYGIWLATNGVKVRISITRGETCQKVCGQKGGASMRRWLGVKKKCAFGQARKPLGGKGDSTFHIQLWQRNIASPRTCAIITKGWNRNPRGSTEKKVLPLLTVSTVRQFKERLLLHRVSHNLGIT